MTQRPTWPSHVGSVMNGPTAPDPVPAKPRRQDGSVADTRRRLFLLFLVAAGLFLRLHHFSKPSMWGDESCMLALVEQPVAGIFSDLASEERYNDIEPPLYFLVLRGTVLLFGNTIEVARLLSAALSLLLIPVTYLIGKRWLSKRAALYGSALTTFSALHVWYAQEARMYGMVTLLGALSTLTLLRFLTTGTGASLYLVAALAAAYTHYYAYLLIFSQLLFGLAYLVVRRRRLVVRFLVTTGSVGLLLLPWLPVLLTDFHHAQMEDRGFPNHFSLVTSIPFVFAKFSIFGNEQFVRDHAALYLFSAPLFGWVLLTGILCGVKTSPRSIENWLFPGLLAIPMALVVTGSLLGFNVYKSHPFIIFSPYFYLLVGSGLDRFRHRSWLLGCMVATNLFVMGTLNFGDRYTKPKVKKALDFVAARMEAGDLLLKVPAKLHTLPFETGEMLSWRYYAPSGLKLIELRGLRPKELARNIDEALDDRERFFVAFSDTAFIHQEKDRILDLCRRHAPLAQSDLLPSRMRDYSVSVYLFRRFPDLSQETQDSANRPEAVEGR